MSGASGQARPARVTQHLLETSGETIESSRVRFSVTATRSDVVHALVVAAERVAGMDAVLAACGG